MRRTMNREVRRQLANQLDQAQILHNHRVHTAINTRLDQFLRITQLILKDENIKGQEPLHPIAMQKSHNFRQLIHPKIVCSGAGIKLLHPKKYRIRSIRHGGPHAVPITGRCQQLYILSG